MKRKRVSSTIDEATTINAGDFPDSQVTDKHAQVTDEQLVMLLKNLVNVLHYP